MIQSFRHALVNNTEKGEREEDKRTLKKKHAKKGTFTVINFAGRRSPILRVKGGGLSVPGSHREEITLEKIS